MPSFAKIITPLVSLLAAAKALPTSPANAITVRSECPEKGKTARVYASSLYTLFPGEPQLASPSVDDFHVQYNNQTNLTIQTAAVFNQLPSAAIGCAFGWSQDDASVGILVAGGDGLLAGRQLSGFPDVAAGVSSAAVEPFDTASPDKAFETEFTGWDREVKGTYHTSGPGKITCSQDIFLIIEKPRTTSGNVFLKKTEGAGLFVQYQC
ncbi:hypothetical protein F4804DRAFT_313969 [Jackrogersella minutella]|nr:hypothetical protein F4804DRAFT_313969 [Jackrogersella minutella]